MKEALYKVPKSVSTEELREVEVKTRESESLEEMHQLVENGDPENVRKLAQSAWDIIVQRRIREAAESEEVQKVLAEEGLEAAQKMLQETADAYIYGARQAGTGASAVTRKKAQAFDKLAERAKTDPAIAAQLKELGFDLPEG